MSLSNDDQLYKARAKSVTGGDKWGIKCPHCQQTYKNDNARRLIFPILLHVYTIHGGQAFDDYLESHHAVIDVPDDEVLG